MLIASDSNFLEEEYNIDDPTKNIRIPTVIVTKDFGDIIREFNKMKSNPENNINVNDFITISIKFSGIKNNKVNGESFLDIDLYFRSDDIKALSFFEEFDDFYKKLKNNPKINFKFTPYYKYSQYSTEKFDNSLNENLDIPCIKEKKLCSSPNYDLGIKNGRKILFENIRQSCIYEQFGQDFYWNYMNFFNHFCLKNQQNKALGKFVTESNTKTNKNSDNQNKKNEKNVNTTKFEGNEIENFDKSDQEFFLYSGKCSYVNLVKLGIREEGFKSLQKCVQNYIDNFSKVDEDFKIFNQKKIYSIPDLYINGIPYRGSWYSTYIARSICNGFLDDEDFCGTVIVNPRKVLKDKNMVVGLMIFILGVTLSVTIGALLLYKKYINRSLEDLINERIQEKTIDSIQQYHIMPQNNESNTTKLDL